MLSLLLQLLRRTRIHALRRRRHRRRRRPHHVDVHGSDRTEPNRVGDKRRESLLRPLLRTVYPRRERDGSERSSNRPKKKTRGDRRRATKCSTTPCACLPQRLRGMGRAWFWLPCRQFQRAKGLCRLGKGACGEGSGQASGGEQGARFAGRRRAAFGIRCGGRAKLKIDFKRSGQEEKKVGDPLQPFNVLSTVEVDTKKGRKTECQPDEVRGPTDRPEREEAGRRRAGSSPRFHTGQATRDSDSNSVLRNNNHVPNHPPPSASPLRSCNTALVRRPERYEGTLVAMP